VKGGSAGRVAMTHSSDLHAKSPATLQLAENAAILTCQGQDVMRRDTHPVLNPYARNGNCKIEVLPKGPISARKGLASMEIRFISSLTSEDEDLFAPAVLKAVSALLDQLPIAYTIRIETTGAQAYEHTHVAPDLDEAVDPRRRAEAISHMIRGPQIG
jgi:hypothetical protein